LIVKAIHIELEAKNFNRNFKKIISIYGRTLTGFKNGIKQKVH